MFVPVFSFAGNNKNVLFIAIDDLRPTLGCYGDKVAITPHLDSFAKKSMVYRNAYCQQAVSGPSRASLLTGLYPDRIGVTDLRTHFREKCPDAVTLPQFFKNKGYNTIGVGKIFHASPRTQDSISWTEPPLFNLSVKKEEYVLPKNRTGQKAAAVEVADEEDNRFIDGKVTEEALARMKDFARTGGPFFLAVGYIKPHLPFSMPEKYWDLYEGTNFQPLPAGRDNLEGIPGIAFHNSEELRGYTDINDSGEIGESKAKELLRGYYACTSFIDAQIGQLLEGLKAAGLDKNTIVVVWGDHGYHLGEQDMWCKSTNFEVSCRVPLLIYDPGYEDYSRDFDNCVESIDVYPTLLDMCGFGPVDYLQGESLLPVITKKGKGKDAAFSQFPRPYNAVHSSANQAHMGYSLRVKDWRCTLWFDVKTGKITGRELYYLPEGRIEEVNLSGDNRYSDIEKELSARIEKFKN